jgi:DnaJ-class molecular chaperone
VSLYDTLGVTKDATTDDIKRTHRKRSRETHPDHGGDRKDFESVQQAYEILVHPTRRYRYDRTGETGRQSETSIADARLAALVMQAFLDESETDPILKIRQVMMEKIVNEEGHLKAANRVRSP